MPASVGKVQGAIMQKSFFSWKIHRGFVFVFFFTSVELWDILKWSKTMQLLLCIYCDVVIPPEWLCVKIDSLIITLTELYKYCFGASQVLDTVFLFLSFYSYGLFFLQFSGF